MQLLWFLPSLAYGVMLAATSHNYFLLVSSCVTIVIAAIVRFRQANRAKITKDSVVRLIKNRIWIDDHRLPRGELFWTTEQFDLVFERFAVNTGFDALQAEYKNALKNPGKSALSFTFGIGERTLIQKNLQGDGPHAILIGSTGSGKTQLLKSILKQFIRERNSHQLVCIDFKGGLGLGEFAGDAIAFASDHDLENANAVITALESELRKRELGQKPKAPLVIAIDELAHLQASIKSSSEVLAAIAARGRSANMHLFMTNQNLVGVGRSLLSNCRLRVLVGEPDPVDAAMLGQLAKQTRQSMPTGWGGGQVLGHGQQAEAFVFALDQTREPTQAPLRSDHEPRRHQHSIAGLREYSSQGQARHRGRRRPAIRGWQLHARKARWR
ncbi:MAG: hypothetical protein RL149_52 [Actinomycetota bacterium]